MKDLYVKHIAKMLGVQAWQVENCRELLTDGCTVPFISRYRKERTGGLSDMEVAEIKHWADVFDEMEKRNIISQSEGSKPRKTLITREQYAEMMQDN